MMKNTAQTFCNAKFLIEASLRSISRPSTSLHSVNLSRDRPSLTKLFQKYIIRMNFLGRRRYFFLAALDCMFALPPAPYFARVRSTAPIHVLVGTQLKVVSVFVIIVGRGRVYVCYCSLVATNYDGA